MPKIQNPLKDALEKFACGKISERTLEKLVAQSACTDLGHTKIDNFRALRTGAAEVIFGAGKTPEQIADIANAMLKSGSNVLATRLSNDALNVLKKIFPKAQICEVAKAAAIFSKKKRLSKSKIAIVSAGTSDMPVAEEARFTAEFLGSRTETFYDCGVAGLHRLLARIDEIRRAKVVIAVAGMEGALPTVLAGLLNKPVIAVPTSVGYGANFRGMATLLSMMNSCANGVSVVNIDNGFGAAYNAHLINTLRS